MRIAVYLGLLLLAAYPMPKNGSCPSGYMQGGTACAPISPNAPYVYPKGNGRKNLQPIFIDPRFVWIA